MKRKTMLIMSVLFGLALSSCKGCDEDKDEHDALDRKTHYTERCSRCQCHLKANSFTECPGCHGKSCTECSRSFTECPGGCRKKFCTECSGSFTECPKCHKKLAWFFRVLFSQNARSVTNNFVRAVWIVDIMLILMAVLEIVDVLLADRNGAS